MKKAIPYLVVLTIILYSCPGRPAREPENKLSGPSPATLTYTIIRTYPHDTTSFTEGLFWLNGKLYESTGNYGESELRLNNLNTGKAEKLIKLDNQYFGEGIAIIRNKLYQLTYKEQKVFVYDPNSFIQVQELEWTTGQGWGMTHNDSELIIGTGNSNLYFVDPETFKVKHSTGVTDEFGPVTNINELEYVNGVIYANIWETNNIVKIDPVTGKVLAKMDMSGLLDKAGATYPTTWDPEADVLNGIAYNPDKNTFYVTGKDWPLLFEIKINE